MSITKRNILIVVLIIAGIVAYGAENLIVIPGNDRARQQFAIEQQDPVTHSISSIIKYKNDYMGNASNIMNLFYSLPLNNAGILFRLFPEKLTAEINYKDAIWNINDGDNQKTQKIIIYNSTAAFALIKNLKQINYNFLDKKYEVTRKAVEKWYGRDLSLMLSKSQWKKVVQNKLNDIKNVSKCFKTIAIEK